MAVQKLPQTIHERTKVALFQLNFIYGHPYRDIIHKTKSSYLHGTTKP